MKLRIGTFLAVFVCLALVGVEAQNNEGVTNFTGNNSTQVVNVQQNGSGFALKGFTGSGGPVGALYGRASAGSGFTNGVWGENFSTSGVGVRGHAFATSGPATGVAGFSDSLSGIGVFGQGTWTGNGTNGIPATPIGVKGVINNSNESGGAAGVFENDAPCCSGDVLIGRSNYYGATKNIFRVNIGGQVFAEAGYFTGGADFAESVVGSGARNLYHPGDVLVIDPSSKRQVALSKQPYSTLVAGIYSTKPGVLAGTHGMGENPASELPLAVVGIVPCKVTAENGAIQAGDLLVTSSREGYAMKGTDRSKIVGAVLGKALEPLPDGIGVIQVLVTLQ